MVTSRVLLDIQFVILIACSIRRARERRRGLSTDIQIAIQLLHGNFKGTTGYPVRYHELVVSGVPKSAAVGGLSRNPDSHPAIPW